MEKAISAEERIRRAEEIYQRRKSNTGIRVSSSNVNSNTKIEYGLFKKLVLQIAICLLIYFIFYLIKNSNYIFSENVIEKTREFLSYDINFNSLYINIENYYNDNIRHFFINEQEDNLVVENQIEEENNEIIDTDNEENKEENAGIGGGEEGVTLIEQVSADNQEENPLSQMEIDANYIKENYSLILPLKGTITSRYGPREPTDIISANHAGIDIAVNEGTVYVSAMDGIVTYVSTEGSYGNHVYIEKDDVTTLYAHCKTIYVKEGDIVLQGQQIGEVGKTRKCNRATFTF